MTSSTLATPPIKTLPPGSLHGANTSEAQSREKQICARPFVLAGAGVGAAKYTLLARALRGPDCTLALARASPYYTHSPARSHTRPPTSPVTADTPPFLRIIKRGRGRGTGPYFFFPFGGGMLYSWLCFRAVLWPRQAPAIFTSGSIISHHLADTCLSSDKPMKRSEIRAYRVVTHREANKRRWRRGRVGVAHRHCRRVATRGRCVHRVPRAFLRARMVQAACTGWPQNHTCC